MTRLPFLATMLLVGGCGGLGDQCAGGNVECRNRTYGLSPDRAALQPGGTVLLTASDDGTADSVVFAVVGGDANGTLSYPATLAGSTTLYTAPASTGTYRVTARFSKGSRALSTQTATIFVAVAP